MGSRAAAGFMDYWHAKLESPETLNEWLPVLLYYALYWYFLRLD
jgi:hypothetical protein